MFKIEFKNKAFTPSLFSSVLSLVVIASMLRLGFWQYERAEEKLQLQSTFDEKLHAPAIPLGDDIIADLEGHRYQSTTVLGKYINDFQFILDNQPRGLISGYDVITPFETMTGIILVNRGWIQRDIDRNKLPQIVINEQSREIRGKINLPGEPFGLGQMTLEKGWPRRIQYIDYDAMAELLKENGVTKTLHPFILVLNDDQLDGFRLDWQPIPQGPQKHYAYMVQWLAMALAVCVLYLIFAFKQRQQNGEGEKDE